MGYQLGVDLGTTYTAAAVIRGGRAEVATLGTRSLEIPSVVLLRADGEMLIGEAAERRSQTEPDRFAREFKRRMGDPTPVLLGGSPFSAHALTARLLRGVVKVVADREGGLPDHTVVTCPANWGEYKRDLLDQAVRQADVGSVSIATEPEAAAVHYAATTRVAPGEIVAVYDLGGGTFDAAILRNTGAGFELLGDPRGIEQLGGVYFDEAVFRWVVDQMPDAFGQLDPDDPGAMAAVARLRRDCVDAKESLSWDTDTTIPVALPNQRTEVRLTRGELEAMIRPTLGDTLDALQRSLDSAGVRAEQLKSVLLVGGSSRIPLVGQLLVADLRRPVAIDVHPKHAVALGAAHLAAGEAGAGPTVAADDSTTTFEPPIVTRAGRTTVTAPAGPAGAAGAGLAAGTGVAAGAGPEAQAHAATPPADAPPAAAATSTVAPHQAPPTAPPARPGWQTEAPGPGEAQPWGGDAGARLPRAGEVGETRRPAHRTGSGDGGDGPGHPGARRGSGRGRSPLVLIGAAVAAVVVLGGAVAALGLLGGDDGGGEDAAAQAEGGTGTTTAAAPPDIPRGEPLATSTIAYTQVDGTFWNVWLVESDGSDARALTRENEDKARLPVLSPDRRSVAYSVEAAGGWELRVTDSAGTGSRTVSTDLVSDARATWSPDGSRLAFVGDRDGPDDVYVLDLASGELTNLTGTPEDEGDPAWSPDGTTIAYWSTVDGDQDLWTIDVETGTTASVTSAPENEADPAWSPDGSTLAYSSDAGGDWEIHTVGLQDQGTVQLTDNDGDDQDPAYSPNGAEIAVESKRDSLDRPDNDWAEIYVMATDGSGQRRVTVRDGLDIHPAWGIAPP